MGFKVVMSVMWLGCKAVMVVTTGTKILEELSSNLKMRIEATGSFKLLVSAQNIIQPYILKLKKLLSNASSYF